MVTVSYNCYTMHQAVLTALATNSQVARYVLYAQIVAVHRTGPVSAHDLEGDTLDASPRAGEDTQAKAAATASRPMAPTIKPAPFSLYQQLLSLMTSLEPYSKRYAAEFMFALCGEDGRSMIGAPCVLTC